MGKGGKITKRCHDVALAALDLQIPLLQCATITGIGYHLHLFKNMTRRKATSIFDSETLFDLYHEQLNHGFD